MSKRTRYGQKEAEASWINAEVEALNTLSAAGLRVPKPFGFFDGVLIMELIVGEDGEPAPRLNDITLTPETALLYHEELIAQIVRMLCSGIIHGDLSEFNVLVDAEGPVIIDLPQAVNAAGNNSAEMMFSPRRGQHGALLRALRARDPGPQVRQGDLGPVPKGQAHAARGVDRPIQGADQGGGRGRRFVRDRGRAQGA